MDQSQNIKSYNNSTVADIYGAGYLSKTLSTQHNTTKALDSGASSNPDLASWYEQAYAYYNAVVAGQETPPDDTSWNSFLDQMQWAAGQLGYSSDQSWDPMSGMGDPSGSGFPDPSSSTSQDPSGSQSASGQTNDFGGTMGPMGSYTYEDQSATIGFTSGATNDIWSNDVTVAIPSTAVRITSEITTDTRMQPPEQVLKIVAHDAATNSDAVYIIHDYQDAKIKVETPTQSQLTDSTGGLVTWSVFSDPSAGTDGSAGTLSDKAPKFTDDNGVAHYVGDSPTDTFDFNFANVPLGSAGETLDVEANANLVLPNDAEVTVEQAPSGSDWDFTATVTLGDGTKYELHLHKPFTTQINGVPEHIHFLDGSGKTTEPTVTTDKDGNEQMVVPSDFADNFTVNGDASTTTAADNSDGSGKTDGTDNTGKTSNKDNKDAKAIDDEVDALAKVTGMPKDQVRKEIFDVYYSKLYKYDADNDGKLSKAELEKAAEKGFNFPPKTPNSDFLKLLYKLDPQLQVALSSLPVALVGAKVSGTEVPDYVYTAIRDRLVTLLQAAYPDAHIKKSGSTGNADDNLWFNGKEYDVVDQGANVSNMWDYLKLSAQSTD